MKEPTAEQKAKAQARREKMRAINKAAAKARKGIVSLESYEKVCDQRDAAVASLRELVQAIDAYSGSLIHRNSKLMNEARAAIAAVAACKYLERLSEGWTSEQLNHAFKMAHAAIAAAKEAGFPVE